MHSYVIRGVGCKFANYTSDSNIKFQQHVFNFTPLANVVVLVKVLLNELIVGDIVVKHPMLTLHARTRSRPLCSRKAFGEEGSAEAAWRPGGMSIGDYLWEAPEGRESFEL